jgi:DNA excision repair protein ERCC-3
VTDPSNPLIVQSDHTVLLEVSSPKAEDARALLARFAELEKAPEHIHTYRITALSLWNAASAGSTAAEIGSGLEAYAKYPVPPSVLTEIGDQMGRYGRLVIVRDFDSGGLAITTDEPFILEEVSRDRMVSELLGERLDGNRFAVRLGDRGALKQALLHVGWPPADEFESSHPAATSRRVVSARRGSSQAPRRRFACSSDANASASCLVRNVLV